MSWSVLLMDSPKVFGTSCFDLKKISKVNSHLPCIHGPGLGVLTTLFVFSLISER